MPARTSIGGFERSNNPTDETFSRIGGVQRFTFEHEYWAQRRGRIQSDNAATVAAVERRRVKDDRLMNLFHALDSVEAKTQLSVLDEAYPRQGQRHGGSNFSRAFARFKEQQTRVTGALARFMPTPIVFPWGIPR